MRRNAFLSASLLLRMVVPAVLTAVVAFVAVEGVQAQRRERTQIEVTRNAAPRVDEPPPVATSAPATQRFGQPAPAGPPVMSPTATSNIAPPAATPSPPPPPVRAAPVPHTLNMIRAAPEQNGQVPAQFMWIRDGLMAVRDPLDNALVFFDDNGRVLGRTQFPAGFDIEDIVGQPTTIRLIEVSHRTQITIPRTIDPATTTALTITPNVSDVTVRARRLTRRGPHELIINDERQNRTDRLVVRSLTGGRLAQAYEISPGTNDNRYVATEEIVAVKPALSVRVVIQRFDRNGKLNGVAYVPLDNFEEVPRNFLAITADGLLRALRPTGDGIKIDEFDFIAPPRGNRRLGDAELRGLSRKVREIAVDTTVQGDTSTPFNDSAAAVELDVAAPPITRAKVMENARAYLTVNWAMQPENFSRIGTENRCDPSRSYIWLRPRHFSESMIGTMIGPMPYRWGGGDTPQTFRTRIELGALAGDICTCRQAQYNYCVYPHSAGVDCSGFVSAAWGIPKRGTSGLLDVANDVESFEALKPGDAFNWAQRHVRLFVSFAPGAAMAFMTLESSTRYECEGICERTYRPSEMNGYRLIRYKGITENGGVASVGDAGPAQPSSQNGAVKPIGTVATGATPSGADVAPPAQNGVATIASTTERGRRGVKGRKAVPAKQTARDGNAYQKRTQWR